MATRVEWTDVEKYSIARLESDLNAFCKKNNTTLEDI